MDAKELSEWLGSRGLLGPKLCDLVEEVDVSGMAEVRSFEVPSSTGARAVLGRALVDFVVGEQEVLLYVYDWGAPEAEQDFNLFERFRQGLGETARVWEKPGHLFAANEHDDLLSLARLLLLMGWGLRLIPDSGNLVIEVSDYDWGRLLAADANRVSAEALLRLDWFLEVHQPTG
jgi:hypothetical protein